MNSRGEGILAVQEERARIGGVEVARKTVIAATDEGLVISTLNSLQAPPVTKLAATAYPALPPPPPPPPPPPKEFSWVDCCFKCDSGYEWYEPSGKGFCILLLLLVAYLIGGAILLAYLMLLCLFAFCGED
ncbi:unnamed protein product [Pocillopora meandrina]|uniref:Uncharacterized protein n=1 Tax=Pocillopora meandrina TaxID=46732 RepID=A0AAU9WGN5_9CNID|nr:unnamed protein product [Pocillopora meandrina]